MSELITRINNLVEDRGVAYVAALLGHKDTNTLKRWLKNEEMPDIQIKGVKAILDSDEAL